MPEIGKENKETEPKITVNFFFSTHNTPEDFNRLPEALKHADVFMPEALAWTKEDVELVNKISAGEKVAGQGTWHSFVYGLKIPIVPIDLPNRHPWTEDLLRNFNLKDESTLDFLVGNFEKAVESKKKQLKLLAATQKLREAFIAENLKHKLKPLTEKFPGLKNKKNINVLVALGATHTSVHKQLKSELQLPLKILGRSPIVFDSEAEIERRLKRNPQENISDELYVRALMEGVIENLMIQNNTTSDSVKILHVARKLVANIPLKKIRFFSEKLGGMITDSPEENLKKIYLLLEEIGIKLPTTEQEIDKLLNIKHKKSV